MTADPEPEAGPERAGRFLTGGLLSGPEADPAA